MSEHVLVVGTGRDFPDRLRRAVPGTETSVIVQLDYIGKVREPGGNARVIGVRGDAPDQEWIDLAAAAHARHPFTRIATFGERDQDRYAAIGEALGLACHRVDTVALVHDKEAMRARLREAGVDSTAHARVAGPDGLRAFVQEHGTPCVVKPISGSGSAGVARVTHESELAEAFEQAGGSYLGLSNSGVLVEEFHAGPQFSVEAFSELGEHQVVAVTRKFSDPATFVELGHVTPAGLPAERLREIEAYVGRVLDALGVEFGPTHTEIVLGDAGPRVIETHVRMGGDLIPALTLDATGVDLDDCAVRQTLGEKVLPGVRATLAEPREPRHAAIWFAALGVSGVLGDVTGLDEARATPGVTEVTVLARPGSEVGPLKSSESRVACARAVAPTADEAVDAVRAAVGHLEFQLRVRGAGGPTV
ncbi:ATP-grasp domain-containing protein [Streptomyces sp. TRM49041]|uniref:ATP-grasp domain-containing protein n=1 Tax=Streptomyces sp. TRM49041 TaxID=2603216 RepID=UPI0011F044DE|nr:ATP-grasp domain-containing protein [Streptomyces sp. TRM49041]